MKLDYSRNTHNGCAIGCWCGDVVDKYSTPRIINIRNKKCQKWPCWLILYRAPHVMYEGMICVRAQELSLRWTRSTALCLKVTIAAQMLLLNHQAGGQFVDAIYTRIQSDRWVRNHCPNTNLCSIPISASFWIKSAAAGGWVSTSLFASDSHACTLHDWKIGNRRTSLQPSDSFIATPIGRTHLTVRRWWPVAHGFVHWLEVIEDTQLRWWPVIKRIPTNVTNDSFHSWINSA